MGIVIAYFGAEAMTRDFIQNFENQQFTAVQLVVQTVAVSLIAGITAPFGAGFLKWQIQQIKMSNLMFQPSSPITKLLTLGKFSQRLLSLLC